MELLQVEGNYQGGQITLDEIPKDFVTARVTVTFHSEEVAQSSEDAKHQAAIQRLFDMLEKPVNLGGGPYYKERGEIYEED